MGHAASVTSCNNSTCMLRNLYIILESLRLELLEAFFFSAICLAFASWFVTGVNWSARPDYRPAPVDEWICTELFNQKALLFCHIHSQNQKQEASRLHQLNWQAIFRLLGSLLSCLAQLRLLCFPRAKKLLPRLWRLTSFDLNFHHPVQWAGMGKLRCLAAGQLLLDVIQGHANNCLLKLLGLINKHPKRARRMVRFHGNF